MPSPQAADAVLRPLVPNGMYNWIPKDRQQGVTDQLQPLDATTEQAVQGMMLQWLQNRSPEKPLTVDPQSVMVCGGVMQAVRSILRAMDPEEQAVVGTITPTYAGLLNVPCRSRFTTTMHESPQGWSLPLDRVGEMLEAMADATGGKKILLICNPNNPNGYVFSKAELCSIVALCKRFGVLIVADEVWSDMGHHPQKQTTSVLDAAQAEQYPYGASAVSGLGKTFNTSAFPCSLMVVPDAALRERIQVTKPSGQAALAAIACIKGGGQEYLQAVRSVLRRNLTLVCTTLNALGFEAHVPDGTSVLFFRIRPRDSSIDPRQVIPNFKNAGFELHEGEYYGMPDHWRMNIACPTRFLEINLQRLTAAYSKEKPARTLGFWTKKLSTMMWKVLGRGSPPST